MPHLVSQPRTTRNLARRPDFRLPGALFPASDGADRRPGAALGGQAGSDVAKCDRKHTSSYEEIVLALPGAIIGGLTGLARAGRILACLMPNVVHLG